ncbi:HAD family hydrolase [Kistimonas asteriae]|uniref:HAD family hydrolase n=1 Tax=Kistimonas asteriae TaxID=517724 RepID=UPI001BAAA2DD|nr:HAD-IA family hydrolase [Kistimonas asteriae]
MDELLDTNDINAVLFDLDGTLLDTADDFIHVLNAMLAEDNRPPLPSPIIRANVSNGSRAMVTLAYGLTESAPDFTAYRNRFLERYALHIEDLQRASTPSLYTGIPELLTAIEAHNLPWGIVTNKPRHLAEPLLEQLQLGRRSSALVCPDDVRRSKPDPESLWLACEQLDCEASRCIYIGDHKRDIDAGRSAGMTTIAALYGFIPDTDDPLDWAADYNAEQPDHILEWLDDICWQLPAQ